MKLVKNSHCSGLTFGTGEKILSSRRTIKIGEKSCVALIVFSLIMAITVHGPIFPPLSYEAWSSLQCLQCVREMRVRTRVLIGPSLPCEQWTRLKWLINKPGACLDWDTGHIGILAIVRARAYCITEQRERERELNILSVQLSAMNIDSGVNVKFSPGKHSLLPFHVSFEHQLCNPVLNNNNIQSYFMFYWRRWTLGRENWF